MVVILLVYEYIKVIVRVLLSYHFLVPPPPQKKKCQVKCVIENNV